MTEVNYLVLLNIASKYLEHSNVKLSSVTDSRNESKYIPTYNSRCNISRYSLLIGVRKGGTRALIDMIGMHSKVHSASNEMHFFDDDENYEKGYAWYQQKMPSCKKHEIVIEKTPSYFVTPTVPLRVFKLNKDINLLLIVRDPVTRLISDYTQLLHNHVAKNLTFMSFEEFVTINDPQGERNLVHNDAILRSMYVKHMKRWLEYFPLSQIHIINGDRLIKKPWKELRKVETFLRLKHEIKKNHFYFNRTKGFHCLKRAGRCLAKSKGRQHPKVSSEVVHKLRSFFRPYNYQFYDLVGQDFGWPEE